MEEDLSISLGDKGSFCSGITLRACRSRIIKAKSSKQAKDSSSVKGRKRASAERQKSRKDKEKKKRKKKRGNRRLPASRGRNAKQEEAINRIHEQETRESKDTGFETQARRKKKEKKTENEDRRWKERKRKHGRKSSIKVQKGERGNSGNWDRLQLFSLRTSSEKWRGKRVERLDEGYFYLSYSSRSFFTFFPSLSVRLRLFNSLQYAFFLECDESREQYAL